MFLYNIDFVCGSMGESIGLVGFFKSQANNAEMAVLNCSCILSHFTILFIVEWV